MAGTENKNQLTLYRFVSLRSPELSKSENQEKRFVFHPDNVSGNFFEAVQNKTEAQTKWNAMLVASNSFSSMTHEDIENLGLNFIKVADWLSLNRSNFEESELLDKIISLNPLDANSELKLWDNLFYQVVTQESFYVKEAIMQILVLQNLLKQTKNLSEDLILSSLTILANAKVVLPTVLFEPSLTETNTNILKSDEENDDAIVSNDILKTQLIETSKNSIYDLKILKEEIEYWEMEYFKEHRQRYDLEYANYQKTIAPILEVYKKNYDDERRNQCAEPKPADYDPNDFCNIPNIEYPNLPEFEFILPVEVDPESMQEKLSKESNGILMDLIGGKNVTSFEQVKQLIEDKINKEANSITENTIASEKMLIIADTVFQNTTNSIVDVIPYRLCTNVLANGKISFTFTIQLPNNLYQIRDISYTIFRLSGNTTNSFFNCSYNGTVMILKNLFNNALDFTQYNSSTEFKGQITFTNGQQFTFEVPNFTISSCSNGKLILKGSDTGSNGENPASGNSFIPKGFGYRQLGIADYKKVVAEVCCYEPGEVAHIENVMASELRSKVTTKTYKSEVTDFENTEIEKENLTDTVSTERFEMQTEVSKLLSEQKQLTAHADVHSSWGTTTLDAGGAYASNTTKEESNRQAVNQAKELTQKAVERIVSRVKTEKTTKITNEFIEQNTHVFDNTGGEGHISGVFRFINAIYKNQIFNYGKRLMYEFTVPQPSKLHHLAMQVVNNNENALILEKPIDPVTLGITDFTKINETNYQSLASKYNALDINQRPEEFIYLGKAFGNAERNRDIPLSLNGTIPVPEGYKAISAKTYISGNPQGYQPIWFGFSVKVNIGSNPTVLGNEFFYPIDNYFNEVPVNIGIIGYHLINITVTVKCQLSDYGKTKWQKEAYQSIINGYQEQLRLYNEKLTEAKTNGVQILDSNPLFYRQIEQQVLRKNCISYLIDNSPTSSRRFGQKMYTGNSILTHQITANRQMDEYGSFAKFMEQAFEWSLMSYNFYPYYWGFDGEWSQLYQYESNDPIFRSFMQAGMARVVVTVKPGFEDAVMHYMATGQIWNGGQTPILGDPLYLSIVDELKEQEYVVDETWKTVVPTHLIALQKSGVSVDEEGLPCSCPAIDELNKQFIVNSNVLKAKV